MRNRVDKTAVTRTINAMQPSAAPLSPELLADMWRTFTETGRLPRAQMEQMDAAVFQSWQRCIARLNPFTVPRPSNTKGQAFASILKAQSNLISIARPIMEDIHQFIEGSDCAILVTDGSACVIEMVGDPLATSSLQELGFGPGSYWSEGRMGTNAFGLALHDAMPVQVYGAEHFFAINHQWTSSAAPIHDVRGRIIGLVGIVGPVVDSSAHTLGLVMASARAISNQLQAEWYLEEANYRLSEVNTVMGTISEGVLAWNADWEVTHVNAQAAEILQFSTSSVLGRPITDLFQLPVPIAEAIQTGSQLDNAEITIERHGRPIRLVASLRPIADGTPLDPTGYIALLSPLKQVRKLVQMQAGTQATLTIDDVYGESDAMRRVLRQARIAARGTAPILLRGEVGVGKNHLAQAIHNDSDRAAEPYVAINCRAIPHELMAMELLGHEKASRSSGHPSKFELADGGTLLLDQAENLSLEMQAAILQLIETRHIMRLQGTHPIPINVRIIMATTKDLERLVADGSFLPHLYYRFGVFNIEIPPLRERTADLPLLTSRILTRLGQRSGRSVEIDHATLDILRQYPWPGNVRELESVLERALHQCRDDMIRPADLSETIRHGRVIQSSSPQPQPVMSVSDAEREAILRAGYACHGRVTEMSQLLGIGRTTLWRKMKRLNIAPDQFKS